MKHLYITLRFFLSTLLLASVMFSVVPVMADEGPNTIIIMGQVKTMEDGYPVIGHSVFIADDSLSINNLEYYKEVITDQDGYFYDTITTYFNNGSFVIYTYDPNHFKFDSIVHFRFMNNEINDNIFIINFSLLSDDVDNHLQASFEYQRVPGDDKFHYSFIDKTNNDNIQKWFWEFGDGSFSTQQNPYHSFAGPGLYTVRLTVTGLVDQQIQVNSTYQYLFIPVAEYYHMGGQCFADPELPLFLIDRGYAYLYEIDSENAALPVDTMKIDTLGYYYFYQVAEGNYLIKVQPSMSSEYYGIKAPTYFGNAIFWEEASIINHDKTYWEYDVNLVDGGGMNSGIGKIAGTVTSETTGRYLSENITKGVDIYLLDENHKFLSSHYTDDNSSFNFDNIALQTYYLLPEITGVQSDKTKISLSEDMPERDEITVNVETGEVVLGIDDEGIFSNLLTGYPYPNPANDQVNMKLNLKTSGDAVIAIYDMQGRLMINETERLSVGTHNISLQTGNLENGIYLIRIQLNNEISDQRFVVSR